MAEEQSRRESFLPEQPPNTILEMGMYEGDSPDQIAQRLSEFAPYGSGETASYMVSNSATVPDQKNTTNVFREVIKQVGLPAENIEEAKAIFDYEVRQNGLEFAVGGLLERFGQMSMSEPYLAQDPRDHMVSAMAEMASGTEPFTPESGVLYRGPEDAPTNKELINRFEAEMARRGRDTGQGSVATGAEVLAQNFQEGGRLPNMNQQYPMQPMANQMAQHGRYGDSMMVHMNPIEVEGIAALSPTGQLTRNPVTGQPEAFLPFLAPLLGSMLGKTVLAKSIPFLAGKSALAGAIGSGLATTAVTGDIKKGLLSGITGFGLGKALGAASDALNPEIAATQTALEGAEGVAAQAGVDLAKEEAARTLSNISDPTSYASLDAAAGVESATDALSAAQQQVGTLSGSLVDPVTGLPSPNSLAGLRNAQSMGQDLSAPFRQPGTFAKELIKPMNLAAVGVGEGQSAALDAQRENEERNRAYEREEEAKRQEALANIEASYSQLERDYPDYQITRDAAAGGIVSLDPQRYTDTVNNVYQLAGERPVLNYANGGPSSYMSEVLSNIDPANIGAFNPINLSGAAASRQSGIRGSVAISPEELAGYRPGFDPEISYFKEPPEETITDTQDTSATQTSSAATGPDDYINPYENMSALFGEDVTGVNPEDYNQVISDLDYRRGRGMFGRQGVRQQKKLREMNEQIEESLKNPPVDLFAQPDGSVRPTGSSNDLLSSSPSSYQRMVDLGLTDGRISAGFDQGGITSLTQENLNPRMPQEKPVIQDDFSEVDMGAMTDTMNANGQALIDRTVMAIAGRLPEDESQMVINEFIEQFGPEAFTQLRDRVLTEIVPNAQTQGEIVGAGGGMDDMIPGMIGDQQRVAVSPGEYIVPADVVSGIGDGSTDAGVDELDQMLDRVREERTGMTRQPPKLASAGGVLPA